MPKLATQTTTLKLTAIILCWFFVSVLQIDPVLAEPNGISASIPNGYAFIKTTDLEVDSVAGKITWRRWWNGQNWRFNPHWESLSLTWKNPTCSNDPPASVAVRVDSVAMASSGGGGGGGGSTSGLPPPPPNPLNFEEIFPFNTAMGDVNPSTGYPVFNSVSACSQTNQVGIRRQNELYVGQNGHFRYNNVAVIDLRAVKGLPQLSPSESETQLATGKITIATVDIPKGFRWMHRKGDWIDYNTQGQIVAYGDNNNNTIWFARDTRGQLRGVVDANGNVLLAINYVYERVTDTKVVVRDFPTASNSLDLPVRKLVYDFGYISNWLIYVTDAKGHDIRYNYDFDTSRLVSSTDQEGRIEKITYPENPIGYVISKLTAADGTVTDYSFGYDGANAQYFAKVTLPATASGNRIEDYTYDSSGKLLRNLVNGKTETEIIYDPYARTETQTNARGFKTVITRNEFRQIVRIDYPDGTNKQYRYSAQNLTLQEEIDEAGVKTQYEYDAKGNRLKKIEAVGTADERTTTYEVNNLGLLTKLTRKGRVEANGTTTPDAIWQIEYDSLGHINKTTDPEGHVRQYSYDQAGNLLQYTDPLGHITGYEVDAQGNLLKATDALGRIESYSYDKVGNLTKYTNARGKAIQAAYDAMNRQTKTVNPVGGVHELQYNSLGLPVAEIDEDGNHSSAEFDNFLQVTKQVDALGNATQYGYSVPDGTNAGTVGALYEPTETKYPTFTQRVRMDERERPTSETLLNPTSQGTEGLVSSTAYDARGQVKSETDANGKTRFYTYDSLSQLNELTDSLGNKTKAKYDIRGNLIQITDALNHVNQFQYDLNDRVTKEILPLGQVTQYTYDAAGNLAERIDANSNKSVFTYDAGNRLTEVKQYNNAQVLQRTTTYTWDEADNLTAWSDTDHTRNETASASLTYDDDDRKTGETINYPLPSGNTYTLSYGYQYSAAGKKTRITWPDDTAIDYSYSAHGELEHVTIPNEGIISVNQFKWIAPAKLTLPGGIVQDKGYDGLLNLESFKVKNPSQQTVLEIANSFGKVQELKQSDRTDTINGSQNKKSSRYTYDDEIQLTKAEVDNGGLFNTDTEDFTLDAVGNRIAYSKVAGAWTYDANNRLIQRGVGANAINYQYDEAGNLTQKTGTSVKQYTYDTQNRLIEVKNGNNDLVARYGYDPQDRRIWKEQFRDKFGNALASAKRTYYLYSDEGLLAESQQSIMFNADQTITANATPDIVTQYGPRPDAEFTTGHLFVKTKNSNGQDMVAYYHHDHLDTPILATDKQGNTVWSASYNVFGKATITTPVATADKPTISSILRFPGQIEDTETGLHYNYRRYYDPETGRYVTQDPIGLAGGINQYRYSDSDPINLSDPTGECPMCVTYAVCVAECMLEDAATNAITGECNNFGDSAGSCAKSCLLGPIGKLGKWFKKGKTASCALNSFPSETLVHTKPVGANEKVAHLAKADLKPISQLNVGDEVLALSDWKDKGADSKLDRRLSYEKVSDIYTSNKTQTLVHLTLANGDTLSATEGHPFKTVEGWRDALLLKKGGKLLLKGGDGDSDSEDAVEIADVKTEQMNLPVFNLEVANAHTYFIGRDGELVHNGRNCSKWYSSRKRAKDASKNRGGDGNPHGPDKYGKDGHFHDGNHNSNTKPNIHYRWGRRR